MVFIEIKQGFIKDLTDFNYENSFTRIAA